METCIATTMLLQTIMLMYTSMCSQFPIRLVVSDQMGAARTGEIVCSGVPFARGILQPHQPVHVVKFRGNQLPTQAKVLGQWPDGSVRWLLVQFPADCPANGQSEYYLVPDQGPEPETPLTVEDKADQIIINTGPLTVTVPKNELTMLGNVRLEDSNPLSSRNAIFMFLLEDGSVHSSAGVRPESVTLEQNGPLRSTVHVVGWLQGPEQSRLYKLDTRLRFYAGQSYVKAEYTFVCLGKPDLHSVKEISVKLSPEVGDTAKFTLPGDAQPTRGALTSGQTALLSVDTDMVCRVGLEDEQIEAENHLDGWGLLTGDDSSVGVAVRDFWHLCPKAIELSPGHIKLALWSARAGKTLNLGRTRAKTHHVLYNFGPPQEPLDRIRAFQEPLIATTDPQYFCNTDALNPLSPAGVPETADASCYTHEAVRGSITILP
jgi:hypothetical protein